MNTDSDQTRNTARSLADMTRQERAECVGMWATTFSAYTGVVVYVTWKQAYLIIPDFKREETFPLRDVYPRFDLPRAWTPSGQPASGNVQNSN